MTTNNQLLTVSEAAAALRVGRSTIRTMLNEGKLPHIRLNKRLFRIRHDDLEKLINGDTQEQS